MTASNSGDDHQARARRALSDRASAAALAATRDARAIRGFERAREVMDEGNAVGGAYRKTGVRVVWSERHLASPRGLR